MSGALAAAVRGAVAPEDVPLVCVGAGVYRSPVALRLGIAGDVVAERLAGRAGIAEVRADRGFLTIVVERPGALAEGIVAAGDRYGVVEVATPQGVWPDRPRTFENPGFLVRYAYARAVAIGRRAGELGVRAGDPVGLERAEELVLLGVLAELPGRARQAVRGVRPLVRYLERLAGAYHDVHERCPALPVGDEKPRAVHGARVTLAEAARIALGNGLNMIGETPRERI